MNPVYTARASVDEIHRDATTTNETHIFHVMKEGDGGEGGGEVI